MKNINSKLPLESLIASTQQLMPFLRAAQAFLTQISNEPLFAGVCVLVCVSVVLLAYLGVHALYMQLCFKALPSSEKLELSVFKGTFKYEAKAHQAAKKSKKAPKK